MEQDHQSSAPLPKVEGPPAEPVGTDSENPQPLSADIRNDEVEPSENQANFPKLKQRTPSHNTTVRAAAKGLEAEGHPITERTIINWCYPTKTGSAKLDCAWDETQLKYFITQESLAQVMADMPKVNASEPPSTFQKAVRQDSESNSESPSEQKESAEDARKDSEPQDNVSENEDTHAELRRLRRETLEQANTIIGKDKVIDTMQGGLEKTVESFTNTLKELSMEQGRLLADNERLQNLLGDGGSERKPDVRARGDWRRRNPRSW